MESSTGQLYLRIYVMYSVWRVVHDDSFIQEYMVYGMYIVQSVYVEWRRTAVFKNICYVQCMKSSARQLYSRIYLWREMNLQGTSLCWGIPTRRIFT